MTDKSNAFHGEEYSQILGQAIDSARIGICICDAGGAIQVINNSAASFFSRGAAVKTAGDYRGENIGGIHDSLVPLLRKAVSGGYFSNHEISIEKEDGAINWLLMDIHPLKFTNNETAVLFLARDVSEQRKCEIDLKRSQTKLSSIVETIPDIVYRVDPGGIITFINGAIREYGYTPEELIGTSILNLIHPDDREKALYRINERRTGERKTRHFEIRLFSKKKEVIEFEFEDSTIAGDQYFQINSEGIYITSNSDKSFFIGTQGMARDITKRLHIERELCQSKEKWVSILNSLEDGYYEVDLKGNIIFVNKSLCDTAGYTHDELIGSNYSTFFSAKDVDSIYKTFNEVYRSGEQAKLLNWTVNRKDGKKRNIEGSVSLSRDVNGKSNGFRGIVRDATEKIKIEQKLLRARKLEAVGILAGGIAHDYNNALTAIMGNISLAKMESENNQSLMDVLNDAEKASFKVMELTKRLSTFSKGGRPVKKKVAMSAFIRETVDTILFKYEGKYEMLVPDDLWEVDIDEIQISHVIEHLLNNALDSVKNDGSIVVEAKNVAIYEEASHHEISLQPGNFVVISIRDNGPGIPAEIIDNIFDPYFTTKEFASGMGLATSYAIIKRHRGYIDVKSEPDNGAVFHVYLPVQE